MLQHESTEKRFEALSRMIEGASSKFLKDIETWRKRYLPGLKKLVDNADTIPKDQWWQDLEKWAESALLWPKGISHPAQLLHNTAHWQQRCYLWMTRLKTEFVALAHTQEKLLRAKIDALQQILLLFPSELMQKLNILKNSVRKIEEMQIVNPLDHQHAIALRGQIELLLQEVTEELEEMQKNLRSSADDALRQRHIDQVFDINHKLDDMYASIQLVNSYFDWAYEEHYIHEVITYLEKLEYLMHDRSRS